MQRLFVLIAFLLPAELAQAYTLNLTVNPFALLNGTIDAGVEFPVAHSWTVGPYVYYSSDIDRDDDVVTARGLGVRGDYSFDKSVTADSWYVSPFISIYEFEDDHTTARARNVGFTIGYRWLWSTGINLRLGLGVMNSSIVARSGADADKTVGRYKGLLPTGDIVLGIAL